MFCDVAGQVVVERPVAGQGELLGDLSDLAHLCVCVVTIFVSHSPSDSLPPSLLLSRFFHCFRLKRADPDETERTPNPTASGSSRRPSNEDGGIHHGCLAAQVFQSCEGHADQLSTFVRNMDLSRGSRAALHLGNATWMQEKETYAGCR